MNNEERVHCDGTKIHLDRLVAQVNYENGITGSSSAADRTVLWFMVRMHVLCTTLELFVLLCKGSRTFNSYS